MLAIIGGSGLDRFDGLEAVRKKPVRTPYGRPSGALVFGRLRGRRLVFLPRHGERHAIAPHEVNYRANIWALHASRIKDVVSVASVGGIRKDFVPGTLVIPDQILDYTHGRESTFNRLTGGAVTHIDFTRPYCESLRQRLDHEHSPALDEALRIAQEAAEVVGVAHAQGVLHRDIKPDNILLSAGRAAGCRSALRRT